MFLFKKLLPLIFVLSLSYWVIKPFFIDGFFPIHDDTQVARVFEMKTALIDGMFPVRWVPDLGYGYGYPIFNFYAPLAYYIGGFFALVGFDALIATKIMMALGIVLSGIAMYFFARQFWGELGGILSGVLYMYAPYHAVEVFVRGDVAEFYGYAFIPLAFLGIYKIFFIIQENLKLKTQNSKLQFKNEKLLWMWIAVGALSYAAIILSHNLTAMMVTPFLLGFAICLWLFQNTRYGEVHGNEAGIDEGLRQRSEVKRNGHLYRKTLDEKWNLPSFLKLLSPLLLGILLSSFYWLPTLAEMKYTNVLSVLGGGSTPQDHFVCPVQLWDSPWGFGGSAPGCIDGMSFKLGKLHILFGLFSLVGLWFLSKSKKNDWKTPVFFMGILLFSLFLTLDQSKFVWDSIPKMDFFQFPWRFLIMVTFSLAFLGGNALWILRTKLVKSNVIYFIVGLFIILGTVFFNTKVFAPQTIFPKKVIDYTNYEVLTKITSKISDEYMPPFFSKPKKNDALPQEKISLADSSAKIVSLQTKTQQIQAQLDAEEKTSVVVNIAYFPAWNVYIDKQKVPYQIFNKGLRVSVPQGKHMLTAVFIQTPIEQIADLLSLTGVLILILGIIKVTFYEKIT